LRFAARARGWRAIDLLLLVLMAAALYVFAAILVRGYLDHSGDQSMASLDAGRSPWHWTFRRTDDLVAGRVFGAARLHRVQNGLRIRSLDGTAVEVGFPLAAPLDLRRAGRLHLDHASGKSVRLDLRVMAPGEAGSCMATLPASAGPTWGLSGLDWLHGMTGRPCSVPSHVSMLRLRIQQPAGADFTLRSAELLPAQGMQAPRSSNALPISTSVRDSARQLADLSKTPESRWPLARLPARTGPQTQLDLRDTIRSTVPGSIVIGPDGAHKARSLNMCGLSWSLVLVYAGFLLLLERRRYSDAPCSHLYLLLDTVGALFGPLWLIAGLRLGPHPAWPDLLIACMGLAWAMRLSRLPMAPAWTWFGQPRDYPAPFALALVLAPLVLLFGHAPHAPEPGRVLLYMGWALLQQWLMLTVVLRRLEHVFMREATAVITCALLFALMHTPNARLMLLCLLAEAWWAHAFLRRRALVPIALAHAVMALAIEASLAGGWLRSLEVGARYFMPR
jgi:hypothetical protein